MQNHQLTPFKYPSELLSLYQQLYSKKIEDQTCGVQIVRGYLTKGPIPHSIEITALLVDAKISDVPGCDISSRLKYSTCIVKFVNGLLDPFQQSLYNISLHRLAQDLKLPGYFVELRHACTHERLPSLQMLRMVSSKALEWIKEQYWSVILKEYNVRGLMEVDERSWKRALTNSRKTWLNANGVLTAESFKPIDEIIKKIKKIRKTEIQEKRKDNTIGRLIKSLKCDEVLTHCLIFRNVLILNKELTDKHLNGIKLMWLPVLEAFDKSYLFELWERLFLLSTQKVLADHKEDAVYINYFQSENEVHQAKEWVANLLKLKIINKANVNRFMELIVIDNDISVRCLDIFKENYSDLIKETNLQDRIAKLQNIMQKFWVLDNSYKKRALDDNETNSFPNDACIKPSTTLFQKYSHWRPVPFGCVPPS